MVLLTECSISHFFSLSFNWLPHSLLLSSPLFSMLHPTTASMDNTASTWSYCPPLSQPLMCLASHFCKVGKCSPPYSRWGMEAQESKDLKITEKTCRTAGSWTWVFDSSQAEPLPQRNPFSVLTCKNNFSSLPQIVSGVHLWSWNAWERLNSLHSSQDDRKNVLLNRHRKRSEEKVESECVLLVNAHLKTCRFLFSSPLSPMEHRGMHKGIPSDLLLLLGTQTRLQVLSWASRKWGTQSHLPGENILA